jgi:arylamine N-acetyltransferase
VNPAARRIGEFADVIAESFTDRATFMHAILIARFGGGRSVTLRNLTLTTVEGPTRVVRQSLSMDELPETIEREFGIPLETARRALDGVELTRQV